MKLYNVNIIVHVSPAAVPFEAHAASAIAASSSASLCSIANIYPETLSSISTAAATVTPFLTRSTIVNLAFNLHGDLRSSINTSPLDLDLLENPKSRKFPKDQKLEYNGFSKTRHTHLSSHFPSCFQRVDYHHLSFVGNNIASGIFPISSSDFFLVK
jgi:hypothetical protein